LARIDKYLWATRLFKTRSLATQACKTNRVLLNDDPVKPAREVKTGDRISVRKQGIWFQYRIEALLKNRVGAKLVPDYLTDVTPAEERERWEMHRIRVQFHRDKGLGRPTKKDRRDMDEFFDPLDEWDDWK